jgi:hypothetical protein
VKHLHDVLDVSSRDRLHESDVYVITALVDVDQEPVIALRRRLYPERAGVTTIAASVTEPGWWPRVPDGRPQLVLAEGLFMYLAPDGTRRCAPPERCSGRRRPTCPPSPRPAPDSCSATRPP